MATTLEVKLRTAALATPALTALLGTSPFRWYDMQLVQGQNTSPEFPAVTVLMVSAMNQYSVTQRLVTSHNRLQLTIWDTNAERARSVEAALLTFMDGFNAMENAAFPPSRRPNEVVMRRQGGNPQTDPLTFWRIMDVMIWHNETL